MQKGGEEVIKFLPFNTTLTSLDLADNSLGTPVSRGILRALTWNLTLRHVSLRGNNINCAVAPEVSEAITSCAALTSLDLSFNKLMDQGAAAIALALPAARRLAVLNLSWNCACAAVDVVPQIAVASHDGCRAASSPCAFHSRRHLAQCESLAHALFSS